MKLLALDTSTEACSVALDIEGQVFTRFELAPRRHAEIILPMIEQLLSEAGLRVQQLDAIAFGRGPGAFTGLRIACGVTQGIAFAADLPVVPVSTLAALAQGGYRATAHEKIIAAIDARMGEVYWGLFQLTQGGLMQAASEERISAFGNLELPKGDDLWAGIGSGWGTAVTPAAQIQRRVRDVKPEVLPHAKDILSLAKPAYLQGAYVSAVQAMPTYLRNKVVK
ncbi:MAG: tRNA (adenosine(37)-N6)-threonylcarbamoyltransferase complex dimerization subunit type 1 TsaB [Gammaproteobacteria bacterium]